MVKNLKRMTFENMFNSLYSNVLRERKKIRRKEETFKRLDDIKATASQVTGKMLCLRFDVLCLV